PALPAPFVDADTPPVRQVRCTSVHDVRVRRLCTGGGRRLTVARRGQGESRTAWTRRPLTGAGLPRGPRALADARRCQPARHRLARAGGPALAFAAPGCPRMVRHRLLRPPPTSAPRRRAAPGRGR